MSRRTTTSYALLGLLSLRSWSTYELTKQVQRSLNWFWPSAERRLYDEPKRLVADGLAVSRAEATGHRPRTVYEITEHGRQELAAWLSAQPAPRGGDFEGMVKVFFADAGSAAQLQDTLAGIEAEAAERVRRLGEMAGAPPVFPARAHLSALCLTMYLEQELAVLAWARWARVQVREWTEPGDPDTWDTDAVLARITERAEQATGPGAT